MCPIRDVARYTLDQFSNSWHCVLASDGQAGWQAGPWKGRTSRGKINVMSWGSVVATTGAYTPCSLPRIWNT
jgi:hypothetical protein